MNDILNNAKRHFADRVSGEMESIEVPEWSDNPDDPVRIYWRPMSLADQNRIFKYVADKSLESMAESIILRSRDIDGKKLFLPRNKTEFMRMVDPKVIERICMAMGGDEDDEVADAEKN